MTGNLIKLSDFNQAKAQPKEGYYWNTMLAYKEEENLGIAVDVTYDGKKLPIYEQAPSITDLIDKVIRKANGQNIRFRLKKNDYISEKRLYEVSLGDNLEYVTEIESIDDVLGFVQATLNALKKRDIAIRTSPLKQHIAK